MTIYVHKEFAELDEGREDVGPLATYAPFGLSSLGGRGGGGRYALYPLGVTLDDADSFFTRIHFKTPSVLPFDDRILFGFVPKSGAGQTGLNSVMLFEYSVSSGIRDYQVQIGYQGGSTDEQLASGTLTTKTEYYLDLKYDGSGLRGRVYRVSDDVKILDATINVDGGKTVSGLDHVGIFSIGGGGITNQYAGAWIITKVHANSGNTYEAPFLGQSNTDHATGLVQLRQPNTSDYTDISSKVASIKIEREFDAVDVATIDIFNAVDENLALFTPNSRIRVKLGFGESSSHFTFIGYIPPHPDYCDQASIRGKSRTFKRANDITLYGNAHKIIPPASADYDDIDETEESSEAEDMFKAARYCDVNNNPEFPFSISPEIIKVVAYAYTNKLEAAKFRFDAIENLDNMECFAALAMLHSKLPENDLTFGGGLFNPKKYLGDTKTDWVNGIQFLNDFIMSRLEKDDSLPAKPRRYYWSQSNHGKPQTIISPYPDLADRPTIIKTVNENEILAIRRSSGKYAVDFIDGLWVDLGDIIYLDTDQYSLRGYYVIAKLDYLWSNDDVNITVYLDRPARVE